MNAYSLPLELDPNLAKQFFNEGSFLFITGIPMGTQFGIDLCSYTIGENFRGVKMIPPGTHFIWTASQGPMNDIAPRVGFMHFFKRKEIIVREWDVEKEELKERQIKEPELEIEKLREYLQELDRYLAPYDVRFYSKWKSLIESVTEQTIKQYQPENGIIRTNMEFESCPDSERPRGPVKDIPKKCRILLIDENDLLPNLKPIEGTAIKFSTVPNRIPKDSSPADVSKHCMDCIEAVNHLMCNFENEIDFIAEIELAFAYFLSGHSGESLAHWRKILNLMTKSEIAIGKYKRFYMKYSDLLAIQMPFLPEELMEPTEYNSVYQDIKALIKNLHQCDLSYNANRLMKKLQKDMMWHFNGILDADPDEQPIVVELNRDMENH